MNIFFRTAVAVLLSAPLAMGQDIRLGVKGSLNLTNIPQLRLLESAGQDLKYMATGGAAVFAELPLDEQFSVRAEVAYNRRGGKLDRLNLGNGAVGGFLGNFANARINLDYIDVTPMLKYKFSPLETGSAYLVAGPSLGILVDRGMSNNLLGFTIKYNLDLNYRDIDVAGVVGVGYEMPIRGKVSGFVEATYRQGFTNAINNVSIFKVDSKSSNFGFSAGLSIPLGR